MQSDFDLLFTQLKSPYVEDRSLCIIRDIHIKALEEIIPTFTEDEKEVKTGITAKEHDEMDIMTFPAYRHLFTTLPRAEKILLKYFYQEKLKLMYLKVSCMDIDEEKGITFKKWEEIEQLRIKLNNL